MSDKENKEKWYILDHRSRSTLLVVIIAILFYVGLTHFDAVRARTAAILNVFAPFVGGFVVAYLLNTPVCFFDRLYAQKLPRFKHSWTLAMLTVYLLALLVLAVLLNMIIPQLIQGIMDLAGNMENYAANLNQLLDDFVQRYDLESVDWSALEELLGDLQSLAKNILSSLAKSLPQVLNFGVAVGSGVVTAFTALIASVYMLAGKAVLLPQLKKLLCAVFPRHRADRALAVLSHANRVFIGFINGKLLDSAIIGVLCFVLCLLFRIPYAMLISVIIGVTNIIPFFGPIIGAVPSVLILLLVDPWAALWFLVLVVVLQQFDGNILGPKILGNSTGLSAFWVLVSIIVGGGLFGFPGMILGVPAFAVIYDLVRQWVRRRTGDSPSGEDAKNL